MALTTGSNLGLLDNGTAGEQHYTELVKFFRMVDSLVMPHVKSMTTTAPPGSPTEGDTYIVPTGATGAWTGQAGKIARWSSRITTPAWEFLTPKLNWSLAVDDAAFPGQKVRYSGSAWIGDPVFPPTPAGLPQVATGIYGGAGAPNNADGQNGYFYFRSDGAAGSRVYFKSAGAWAAIL